MIEIEGERRGRRCCLYMSPGGKDNNQSELGSHSTRCAKGKKATIVGRTHST